MDTLTLEKQFARLGAKLEVRAVEAWRRPTFGIDIQSDARGERFVIDTLPDERVEMSAVEVRPNLRHLLLFVRRADDKEKYLCGHDERHWFVAGVPSEGVTTVASAMAALRPDTVPPLALRQVRARKRLKRRNEAFVRQGEWFFVPEQEFVAPASLILRREPLSRGDGGKSHWCEELSRDGGTPVYVCRRHPRGVSYASYAALLDKKPEARNWDWRLMRLNARVYARGRISHPDHKTITLPFWHRVLMNDEHRRGVVFLD